MDAWFDFGREEGEVGQLTELIADHPLADRLNLLAVAAYRRLRTEPAAVLSEREAEILERIHDGATNEQIGKALYLSVNTIKFHRATSCASSAPATAPS